jgi:hypothetical protein
MSFGGITLALSAVQAVNAIGSGYAQKAESDLNATILEGKAGLIDIQKGIEKQQYQEFAGRTASTSYAGLGASGIMPSGSAIDVMIETQRQIGIDQAIGQFNYDQEKRYTMAQADEQRRAGKLAVRQGWTKGLTSILEGASKYAMYKTPSKTSFDFSNTKPFTPRLDLIRKL